MSIVCFFCEAQDRRSIQIVFHHGEAFEHLNLLLDLVPQSLGMILPGL